MKNGKLQAKDIPDVDFLFAVGRCQFLGRERLHADDPNYGGYLPWALWGSESFDDDFKARYGPFVTDELPGIPVKVLRAKGQRLIDRGLMTGCMCGCRGDMELTVEGLMVVAEHYATSDRPAGVIADAFELGPAAATAAAEDGLGVFRSTIEEG